MANKGSDDWISWTNYTSGTFNVSFDDSASFGALTNVQCESCHGPASDHTMNPGMKPELDLSAENCGQCHQDAHHPYLEEWSLSKHSLSLMDHLSPALANLARTSPECSGCHTVQGFIQFVGETSQDSTNIMPDVTPPGDAAVELVCAACHDPHPGVQHDSQLRLPKADLCVKCHNPEDAQPPDTPHHATSSMWDGVGAVEFPGFDQGKK
jgi:predicted CXXCH cytochrome family protein